MDAQARLMFNPVVEPFVSAAGDLYLLPGPGRRQRRIPAPHGRRVAAALHAMEAGAASSVHDALPGLPLQERELVGQIIDELALLELVVQYAPRRDQAQYDRQIRYFLQEGLNGAAAQHALTTTRALVLGLGGLGSVVAEALARVGVGAVHGVDFDTVQLENLPRQTLYTPADIGQPKADVAQQTLRRIAPDCEVSTDRSKIESAEQVVALARARRSTVIFLCADSPRFSVKMWCDDAAHQLGMPVLMGGHRPPMLYVGPMIVPGETRCFHCFKANEHPLIDEMDHHLDATSFVAPGLGYADQLVGNMLVSEFVGWAAGTHSPSILGREYAFDLHDYTSFWIEPGRAGCPRCAAVSAPDRNAA